MSVLYCFQVSFTQAIPTPTSDLTAYPTSTAFDVSEFAVNLLHVPGTFWLRKFHQFQDYIDCKTDRDCPSTSFCGDYVAPKCTRCYNCGLKNRLNVIRCARSSDDCGDCMPGWVRFSRAAPATFTSTLRDIWSMKCDCDSLFNPLQVCIDGVPSERDLQT